MIVAMGAAEPSPQRPSPRPASAHRARLPLTIEPMLATMGGEPFDSPQYIFEIKWDGVRALAFIEEGSVRLQDRYLRDVTGRYPELAALAAQVAGDCVLDGEIVALDEEGAPDFARLSTRLAGNDEQAARRLADETPVTFQAFDILYWEGRNVMAWPLWRRKGLLHRVTRPGGPLLAPDHLESHGISFFEAVHEHGLEGVIAKDRRSAYRPGARSPAWLKLKVFQKEEFVVGGFTYGGRVSAPRKRRRPEPIASLLLGLYDERGDLRYVGDVSGGFTDETAREMARVLDGLTSRECPFADEPRSQRLVFWCRPQMAASVRFSEWTREGGLRFPVFEGLRPDVPPETCRLADTRP